MKNKLPVVVLLIIMSLMLLLSKSVHIIFNFNF